MGLFKRNKTIDPPSAPTESIRHEKPPVATLKTGRMANVYLKMYLWIFSVSLNYNSYQLESGNAVFANRSFPVRGYYNDLFNSLLETISSEQVDEFKEAFDPKALELLFTEGRTCVSGMFFANLRKKSEIAKDVSIVETDTDAENAENAENAETEGSNAEWYEFRVDRIPVDDSKQFQFIFYIRFAAGEKDDGSLPPVSKPPVEGENSSYNWDEIRIKRVLNDEKVIYYEYDVTNDIIYFHRLRDEKKIDHVENNFLKTLNAHSDWMFFHESVKDVHRLFQNAIEGISGETEIRYRKDGLQGAAFIHYMLSCQPLEERGKPTWIIGSLKDIEKKVLRREENNEIMRHLDLSLENFYTSMHQINMNHGTITAVLRSESGFSLDKNPQRLDVFINSQIRNGIIAEESAQEYLNLLKQNYLKVKTAKGSFEFEALLRTPGSKEYRWYLETITAVKNKPGVYMRMNRDITETKQIRRMRYEMETQSRFSEYSRSVLDTMASLVEFRNTESGEHIKHVRDLTHILLVDIAARSPEYHITQKMVDFYTEAATIHDIGKVTISDTILNKTTALTHEEYETMKLHTTNGAKIVEHLNMTGLEEMKPYCYDVVLHHHERFDGNGYPDGLKGDEISIGVQAVSIADTYDALVSERCYKAIIPFDEALEMILTGKCGVFNPLVLDSLKAVEPQIRKCYLSKENASEEPQKETIDIIQE